MTIKNYQESEIFGDGSVAVGSLGHGRRGYRIVDVLTTDKLTDHQIAAKVREYFHDHHQHQHIKKQN